MASHLYSSISKVAFGESGREDEEETRESWTQDKGSVYPMVMSIGWNPFYKNEVRSVEVHIIHHFEKDFYGSHMNLVILGFIRPEYDYVSKEKLVEDIKVDIEVTGKSLARKPYAKFRGEKELLEFSGKGEVAS